MSLPLLQDPFRAFLVEISEDPEVQGLIADAITHHERLVDKVISLAQARGVPLSKIPCGQYVTELARNNNIDLSRAPIGLDEWLAERQLSWSALSVASE
jgi:hypothetical protein